MANLTNPVVSIAIPTQARSQNLRVVATVGPSKGLRKNLSFSLAASGKSLSFKTISQARLYSVERYQPATKMWSRVSTVASSSQSGGSVRVNLPSTLGKISRSDLRVVAVSGEAPSPSDLSSPVPLRLRSGVSAFPARKQTSSVSLPMMAMADSTRSASSVTAPQDGVAVEEADLWKIRGRKIYLFNQLRGLQILDTTDAHSPVVVGFWPLSAMGEDMYLLGAAHQPAQGALLLARLSWKANQPEGTRVVRLGFTNDIPSLQTSLDLPGSLQESRMAGTRLHLVTTSWQDEEGNWSPTTWVITLDVSQAGVLVEESRQSISRYVSAVGNTGKYLWLAGSDAGNWSSHILTAFPIQAGGTLGSPIVAQLGGVIQDKFKVGDVSGGLAAVVQTWTAPDGSWRNRTLVETYRPALDLGGVPSGEWERRAQMEIIQNEWLYATRFDGDRLYAVTFRQVDPLWLIDLSNPETPTITSHLEVPGWSSFIEPLGNLLVAVGREGGQSQVSLFDVSDPSSPRLASRVNVGDSNYSWSEAEWNEKAVKILPESGLILVPVTEWSGGLMNHRVRLLGLDQASKALTALGTIRHDFSPRRSSLLDGDLVASVSNRELLLVDVNNRGEPVVQSEVTLAFGVDRLAVSPGYLYQFENGNPWLGGASTATMRVAPSNEPDTVMAQIGMKSSYVYAAEVVGNRLVVVEGGQGNPWMLMRWAGNGSGSADDIVVSVWSLLDPSLPALVGQVSLAGQAKGEVSVLSASPDTVAVTRKQEGWGGLWSSTMSVVADARIAYCGGYPWRTSSESLAVDLIRFQGTPSRLGSWNFSDPNVESISKVQAFGDLLVLGYQKRETTPITSLPIAASTGVVGQKAISLPGPDSFRPSAFSWTSRNWLQVLDLADPSLPTPWAPVEIPGQLLGVSWLQRGGGVLFSQSGAGDNRVYALGFDGESASVAAEVDVGNSNGIIASGNSVYSSGNNLVQRWDFSETSSFFGDPLAWQFASSGIRQIEIVGGQPWVLCDRTLYSLASGAVTSLGEPPGWPDLGLLRSAVGDVAVPCGDYGTFTAQPTP